ncbi:hypothetical protein [Diplocloster modestus]|uniref:Uncharacterized protein n=1 Tax=Diplocloster modestus TaxID=2850322 RepID=A0ABS6KDA0_9FIRM|nr:hypothetical protein [Diplocloster modestus]MBU9728490.1 hypothetical protein [Diplocloster modestus]
MDNGHDMNPLQSDLSEDYINSIIQRGNKIRQVMGTYWMLDYEMLTYIFGEYRGDPWRQAEILELIYEKIDRALLERETDEEQNFLKTLYCFDF